MNPVHVLGRRQTLRESQDWVECRGSGLRTKNIRQSEFWRELTKMRHWLRGIVLKATLASSPRAANGRTRVPQWSGNKSEEVHHRRPGRVSSRRRRGTRFLVFAARNVGEPTSGCSCGTGNPCGSGSACGSSNSCDSCRSRSHSLRRRRHVPCASNSSNSSNSSGSFGASGA